MPWYSWNTAKVGIKHQSINICKKIFPQELKFIFYFIYIDCWDIQYLWKSHSEYRGDLLLYCCSLQQGLRTFRPYLFRRCNHRYIHTRGTRSCRQWCSYYGWFDQRCNTSKLLYPCIWPYEKNYTKSNSWLCVSYYIKTMTFFEWH